VVVYLYLQYLQFLLYFLGMSRSENLAHLIRKLRGGMRVSHFAQLVGVSRDTINRWERGEKIGNAAERLAAYCGISLQNLESYLEGHIPLDEFVSAQPSNGEPEITIGRVLAWLQTQPLRTLGIVTEMIGRIVADRSNPSIHYSSIQSIQTLIQDEIDKPHQAWSGANNRLQAFANESLLDKEEIEALLQGDRPTREQLIALARILTKPDGSQWELSELENLVENPLNSDIDEINGEGKISLY
jgi:transcriptional regulator with XRE-family HTH domain